MFFLPEPHGERVLTSIGRFDLYDATSQSGFVDAAEGALALVALPSLQPALMVDHQDSHAGSPKGFHDLLMESNDIS